MTLFVAAALLMLTLSGLPLANQPLMRMPGVLPFELGMVVAANGVTALLMFIQFQRIRVVRLLWLAAIFQLCALMGLAEMLSCLGLFIGHAASPRIYGWQWTLHHMAMPLLALGYVQVAAAGDCAPVARPRRAGWLVAIGVTILVVGLTMVLTGLGPILPASIGPDRANVLFAPDCFVAAAQISLSGLVVSRLLAGRHRHIALHNWLALWLVANACEVFCAAVSSDRFTVYWLMGRVHAVAAATAVLGLLLWEINRLYGLATRAALQLARANQELEQRVADGTRELSRAASERSLLLGELYHRVRNNLQILDEMVGMQARRLSDAEAKEALAALRMRIHALGLVHQQLMTSDNLADFEIAPFLRDLAETVTRATSARPDGIDLELEFDPLRVTLDFAIPLGLLVTELLTNALRHAFPRGEGKVAVQFLRRERDHAVLAVADEGGEAAGSVVRLGNSRTLGTKIIRALVAQLDGELHVTYARGMRVEVLLPLPRAA